MNQTKFNLKDFAARFTSKMTENIQDMIVTVAAIGILLAYLLITQPLAAIEYGGYIIAIYLCILFRRIVQDFDDSYTTDELAERIDAIQNDVDQIQHALS